MACFHPSWWCHAYVSHSLLHPARLLQAGETGANEGGGGGGGGSRGAGGGGRTVGAHDGERRWFAVAAPPPTATCVQSAPTLPLSIPQQVWHVPTRWYAKSVQQLLNTVEEARTCESSGQSILGPSVRFLAAMRPFASVCVCRGVCWRPFSILGGVRYRPLKRTLGPSMGQSPQCLVSTACVPV